MDKPEHNPKRVSLFPLLDTFEEHNHTFLKQNVTAAAA